jgi:transposase
LKTYTPSLFIGVDVAKDSLQIACSNLELPPRIANNPQAIESFVDSLKNRRPFTLVACEATGGLERLFVDALHRAEVPVSVLNPRQVRYFAKAGKQLAKTDKIDAAMLADYASRMPIHLTPQPNPTVRLLADLSARREDLCSMATAEKNRLHSTSCPWSRSSIQRLIDSFKQEIKDCEAHMHSLVASDPILLQKYHLMLEVKGIGPISASRYNHILSAFYQRLCSKLKPKKVALVALMRKLIIHLNRILKPLAAS